MEERNERLTRGLSAVDKRFKRGPKTLFVPGCWENVQTACFQCFGEHGTREICPLAEQPVESTCRVQNPDIPRAGLVGAHGGEAGQDQARMFANRIVRLGNNPSSHSPKPSKTRRLNVSPEAQTSESM